MNPFVARREPRGFTITDLLVVSLGYAICWAAFSSGHDVFALVYTSVMATPVVVGLVILFRQWRHGRPARAAEHSVLVSAAFLIAMAIPSIDTALDGLYPNVLDRPLEEWSFWRWSLAGVVMVVVSICWSLDWRRFPYWLRTLGSVATLTAFFWGPLLVVYRHLDLLQYVRSIDAPFSLLDATLVEIQRAVQPAPIHFAILLTVALAWNSFRTKRRRWTWIDWFSMATGLVMTVGLCTSQWFIAHGSEGVWLVAWAVWPAMVLIEAIAAFVTVGRVRRWRQRRLEPKPLDKESDVEDEADPREQDTDPREQDPAVDEKAVKHDSHLPDAKRPALGLPKHPASEPAFIEAAPPQTSRSDS